jgi:hypothetical protein
MPVDERGPMPLARTPSPRWSSHASTGTGWLKRSRSTSFSWRDAIEAFQAIWSPRHCDGGWDYNEPSIRRRLRRPNDVRNNRWRPWGLAPGPDKRSVWGLAGRRFYGICTIRLLVVRLQRLDASICGAFFADLVYRVAERHHVADKRRERGY